MGSGFRFVVASLRVLYYAMIGTMCTLHVVSEDNTPYSPDAPFFSFNGHLRIFGEYDNQSGSFMEKQPRYGVVELAPSFAIYGLPFSASFLYSTEDHNFHQQINSASISLNPTVLQNYIIAQAQKKAEAYLSEQTSSAEQARDSLQHFREQLQQEGQDRIRQLEQTARMDEIRHMDPRDLANQKQLLQDAGLLSSYEKIMLLLPRISVGTTYPLYTDMTLSGIAVKGYDIEWTPGQFIFAYTRGQVLNPVPQYHPFDPFATADSSLIAAPVFARSMQAFRIGFGSKLGSAVIFSLLSFKDDPNSVTVVQNDSVPALSSPESNLVADVEWRAVFFNRHLSSTVELASSLFTYDNTSSEADLGLDTTNSAIQFLRKQLDLRVSSNWDWAATVALKGDIPETGTRASVAVRRLGTGYHSLGLLNQRTDFIRTEARADQSLFQHQFSVGGFFREDHDNLADWKSATTSIQAFGVNVGISPRSYPFLRLSYSPYKQSNNAAGDSLRTNSTTTLVNATLGYSYRIIGASHSTAFTYSNNTIDGLSSVGRFSIQSLSLSHTTSFQFPLSLTAAVSRISQKADVSLANVTLNLQVWDADLSATYVLKEIWNLSAGASLADEQTDGTRIGFFAALSVPIGSIAVFDCRAEKNVFRNSGLVSTQQYLYPYDETIIRATLSKYW